MLRMCFPFLICGLLYAQVTTTTVHGTVTDQSGAIVANAHVSVTNTDTGLRRSVDSGNDGEYRVEFLPIGPYRVETTAPGFSQFVQTGIVLEVNQIARVDAVLAVGTATEKVEITAEAPQVNTDNATLGRTVNNAEITQLPIVNRNVYTLLTLTPGVQSSSNSIVLGYPSRTVMNEACKANEMIACVSSRRSCQLLARAICLLRVGIARLSSIDPLS